MTEHEKGYGIAGCLDNKGNFDIQEMYKQIYMMQVVDGVKQSVIAHMYDIGTCRVGQIKKQYIEKHGL